MKSEKGGVERVGEKDREGAVEIWIGSRLGKLNISNLSCV